ncbi:SEC23-interacting protein [Lates japonicus]|uniref:SEC23-interacting protein n=1 Tax=Lates japonicus TaxID=270547 RepID=A0AAD3MJQ0_LATJO|nr:SEC23-interacting protein [Lates japonicus]
MADRKNNNVPNTGANLLAPLGVQLQHTFMPVGQATGPAVLSGRLTVFNARDDLLMWEKKTNFLGQTSWKWTRPHLHLQLLLQPVTTSDPFASAGQSPCLHQPCQQLRRQQGLVPAPTAST